MDNISLERFNYILQKQIAFLTPDEISFLKARRDALTPIQKAFYAELLEEKIEKDIVENTEVEKKKPVKKK